MKRMEIIQLNETNIAEQHKMKADRHLDKILW